MRLPRTDRGIPVALMALSLVPALAGAVRVTELVSGTRGGAAIMPENARFYASPWPVTVLVVAVIAYGMLGALQFSERLRRRRRAWHRATGRVMVACGLLAAVTGLRMTLRSAWAAGDGLVV